MHENALLVPQEAITEIQGRYQVALIQPNNTVKIVNVGTSEKYNDQWIVTSGLTAGQRIIAEGTSKVRDGETVTPQNPQTKPTSPYGSRGEAQ